MKRCAIYARFSTEMQRATSLEDQIRNCRQFAARMGWEILEPHVYQDTAVSGFGVEHRPAYQQLVSAALAAAPSFTVILVDDLSRLSRDLVETLTVYRRLKRNSVELVAVADGIQTTHQMATLQITIKGLVNELYLDDLRDKTHRGLTGRALKGRSTGGRLFGYRTSKGDEGAEWVVFEPEAEIVRRIFRLYADTQSMKAITVKLNAEGVPFPAKATRRGPMRRGWAVSTIHTIVLNEKYRGRWVWNKTMFVKDPATGKRTPAARPKDDWVVEERPDLAIVDGDLWTRVQARLTVVREAYGANGKQTRPPGTGAGGVFTASALRADPVRCVWGADHDSDQPAEETRCHLPLWPLPMLVPCHQGPGCLLQQHVDPPGRAGRHAAGQVQDGAHSRHDRLSRHRDKPAAAGAPRRDPAGDHGLHRGTAGGRARARELG